MRWCPDRDGTPTPFDDKKKMRVGANKPVRRVVLHTIGLAVSEHASQAPGGCHATWMNESKDEMVSAHFRVERDGLIVRFADTDVETRRHRRIAVPLPRLGGAGTLPEAARRRCRARRTGHRAPRRPAHALAGRRVRRYMVLNAPPRPATIRSSPASRGRPTEPARTVPRARPAPPRHGTAPNPIQRTRNATLRQMHALWALVVGTFLVVHMGNHLVGLWGQDHHVAYVASARRFYRHPLVEPVLLVLLVWQVASGLWMVMRSWSTRSGAVAWLQALSGAWLAFFLCVHVGAVLFGRASLGLDTDFRFAAAGFHVSPWQWFFAPYYYLAVFCLFAHVGCAVFWNIAPRRIQLRRAALALFLTAGVVAGALVDLALAGKLFPVEIPPSYRATYSGAPR